MKKILVLSALLISLQAIGQNVGVSQKTVDFGKIPMQPRSEKGVWLYNRAPKPIVINAAKVDCNCTKVEWSKRPIMAGDSTLLKIIYSPTESGTFYKKIKIGTSGGDCEVIIRGNVAK